jgi:hypothetical protein
MNSKMSGLLVLGKRHLLKHLCRNLSHVVIAMHQAGTAFTGCGSDKGIHQRQTFRCRASDFECSESDPLVNRDDLVQKQPVVVRYTERLCITGPECAQTPGELRQGNAGSQNPGVGSIEDSLHLLRSGFATVVCYQRRGIQKINHPASPFRFAFRHQFGDTVALGREFAANPE